MTFLDDRLIAESGLELGRFVDTAECALRHIRPNHAAAPDADFADEFDDEVFTLGNAICN